MGIKHELFTDWYTANRNDLLYDFADKNEKAFNDFLYDRFDQYLSQRKG